MAKKNRKKSSQFFKHYSTALAQEIIAFSALGFGTITFFSIKPPVHGAILLNIWHDIISWGFGSSGMTILIVVFWLIALIFFLKEKATFSLWRVWGTLILLGSTLGISALITSPLMDNIPAVMTIAGHFGYSFGIGFYQLFGSDIGIIVSVILAGVGALLTFGFTVKEVVIFIRSIFTARVSETKKVTRVKNIQEPVKDEIIEVKSQNIALNDMPNTPNLVVPKVVKNKLISPKIINTKFTSDDDWEPPSLDFLADMASQLDIDHQDLQRQAQQIKEKLAQFNITVTMKDINVGPTVTQFTLEPASGVKLSKIANLGDDLALALKAKSIRIEAPIPEQGLVGVEIPNAERLTVGQRELLESTEYQELTAKTNLTIPLGRNVAGKFVITDLGKMPHLLIAGATGAGKSVCTNSIIISLLYQNSPQDLRLILIDPKQVEMSGYNGIPHLLAPVVTNPEQALSALRWATGEMTKRYRLAKDEGARSLAEYNIKVAPEERLPKIVIIIDELADLMMSGQKKETEAAICRIAQMARAVGIHLIIATQRPSVDVITGLIKANIPSRIALTVRSSIDSRTVIDSTGAEKLLGYGDMLYLGTGSANPERVQGIFIAPTEINKVVAFVKLHTSPVAHIDFDHQDEEEMGEIVSDDPLFFSAIEALQGAKGASASLLQRKLSIGYARAARLLDEMQKHHIIGAVNGAKPRKILVDLQQLLASQEVS